MAGGEIILKIGGELAERLRTRAAAAGQSVEEYALGILWRAVEQPGFEEDSVPWDENRAHASRDNGFREDADAYADEIDRICDEAERTGGVPWEQFRARLMNLGDRTR
ncbi:hypothetical protein BH10PSE3_BH10PSE3_15380 [soil metagenome]